MTIDDNLEYIFKLTNDAFTDDKFPYVDYLLIRMVLRGIWELDTMVIIAWLSATLCAERRLNHRMRFFNCAKVVLSTRYPMTKVNRLLSGL